MRPHVVTYSFTLSTAAGAALVLALGVLAACRSGSARIEKPDLPELDSVPAGEHELARIQYNDTNDVYRVFLAANPKTPLRLRPVKLALLTEEQVRAGKTPYVVADADAEGDAGAIAYLGPRFKLGVLHGVVERRVHPDDPDKRQNVVVRAERKLWSPFLAPKLDAEGKSIFHTPAVHYPPPLTSGPLVGTGGSGATREQAWDTYRRRNGSLPQAVRLELEGYVLAKDLAKDDDDDDGNPDGGSGAGNHALDAGPGAPEKKAIVVDAGPISQRDVIGIKPVPAAQELRAREALRKQRLEEERLRKAREASKSEGTGSKGKTKTP